MTPYRSPAPPPDDHPNLQRRVHAWFVLNAATLGTIVVIGTVIALVIWTGISGARSARAEAALACARTCTEFGVERWRSEGTRTCRCLGETRVIIVRHGVPTTVVEVKP